MKKAFKILGILAAVLVVLLVILVVLVRVVITPERIKAVVLPKAEEALGRDVSLGEVEISLFKGITLHNLVVGEREGTEPFVAADRVVLRYQLRPLLQRRVVIDEVRLEAPLIRVERLEDGTFNFSDLLEREETEEAVAEEPDGEREPVDLLVSEVAVLRGRILVVDHAISPETPFRFEVEQLDFSARDISLERSFPWSLGGRLNGSRLAASGTIDPQTATGEADLEIADFDVTAFAPYYRDAVPGRLESMTVNLNLGAQGGAEYLSSRGKVTVEGINLVLEREGEEDLPLRGAALGLDFQVDADLAAQKAQFGDSVLTFNGIPVRFSGLLENYAAEPQVAMRVEVPEVEIRSALAALPPELLPPAVTESDPAGRVAAWVRLAGAADDPQAMLQEGEVTLGQASALVSGERAVLSGGLRLEGESIASRNLTLQMGENRANIDVQVKNLFGDILDVTSAVRAERFALDPLLKGTQAPSGEGPAPAEAEAEAPGSTPIDLPLRAQGTVQIGRTVYQGLSVDDFQLEYLLEKNVLTVRQVSGKVVGGTFQGGARADLGREVPPFETNLQLKSLQADPMVSAFFPKAAGTIFGDMTLDLQMAGKGTESVDIRRNLSGKGALQLRDGRLTGAGLVQGLADFLNLEELRVMRFSQAKGSFTIRDGRVLVDSDIDGQDVRMNPKGSIALEDLTLDLTLNPRFSPELTKKLDARGTVTRFLVDEQGWGRLPIRVAGTFDAPRFILDTSGVQQQLKEKAEEEIKQQLQRGLERLVPSRPEGEEPPAEQQPRRQIEDTLRGLFGR